MSARKRLSLMLAAAALAVGSLHGQTPLVLMDAELAVPFGAAKGQMAFVADQIVFVSAESPKSSLTISRADIAKIDRSGDVITIVTRRQLRDSDGERDTFRFRLSQSANVMRWYEAMPSAAAAAMPSTSAPAGGAAILASYSAKHGHLVGSCQGTLILTEDAVSFESQDKVEDSRKWKLADIKKVEQSGIYKLKVEPFQGGAFDLELNGKGIDSGEFRQLVDRIARARVR